MSDQPTYMYAWCFDHGDLHVFPDPEKTWCSATWVPFTATNRQEAIEAKQEAYGDAKFFDQLVSEKKLEVIEIRETWIAH